MKKGSLLAGLRPRDDEDESETELEGEDEAPESKPAPKPASRAGVKKPTPEETRALDLRIFSAADILEVSLGREPTHGEIVAKAKVPGPTDNARKQRVRVAMRRRGLLVEATAPAKKPSSGARPHKVQDAPIATPAPVGQPGQAGVHAVEALRDRLRAQLDAVEVTLAALRGER